MAGSVGTVLLAAFALVMIGFSQTACDARAFATKHHDRNVHRAVTALERTAR